MKQAAVDYVVEPFRPFPEFQGILHKIGPEWI
jgi:hypothetical protein